MVDGDHAAEAATSGDVASLAAAPRTCPKTHGANSKGPAALAGAIGTHRSALAVATRALCLSACTAELLG